jgi:hypothetical protein
MFKYDIEKLKYILNSSLIIETNMDTKLELDRITHIEIEIQERKNILYHIVNRNFKDRRREILLRRLNEQIWTLDDIDQFEASIQAELIDRPEKKINLLELTERLLLNQLSNIANRFVESRNTSRTAEFDILNPEYPGYPQDTKSNSISIIRNTSWATVTMSAYKRLKNDSISKKEYEKCPICYSDIGDEEDENSHIIILDECGHCLHKDCHSQLNESQTNASGKCPLCR